ncbi:unnamed protein product [Coregonus sp. 'balchen']|nr:unnamed protein product [Coregonus sp. 'balchen']
MILEVQGGYLQLNDIETKTELESVPLGSVVQTKAVLDTCAYNSLLTVMVQERNRRIAQVFMFQCEEVRSFPLPPVFSPPQQPLYGQEMYGGSQQYGARDQEPPHPQYTDTQRTVNLPHWEEFVACLQKIKYGFNLLLMSHYPPDLPTSVLIPLLTEPALILLSLVVTPEEDKQWRALGDAWNIPRSNWPDSHMLPPYNPEFYDGWLPPKPVPPAANQGLRSSNSQHIPPREEMMQQMPDEPMMNSPPPSRPSELAPDRMCVIYDFMARNPQELSILKGEVVQVVDKSGQWWRVRNERGEEGHVAKNVLEPLDGGEPWGEGQKMRSPPPLNMQTVRSLSVLNGALLLGMTRDDMKMVCPEEGGRVFFQLQAIKSSIALASESNGYGPYNGR